MSDFSTVRQNIRERRTIRSFRKDAISKDVIMEILETAVYAPNHKEREPWRFVVYVGEGSKVLSQIIRKLPSKGMKLGKNVNQKNEDIDHIPCHIVVITEESPQLRTREEDYAAVCTCIQNIQLAAWAQGIGVVWKTGELLEIPAFREAVGVLRGEKIVGLLHMGYPENIPEPVVRTPASKKTTIIDTYHPEQFTKCRKIVVNEENVFLDLGDMSQEEVIQFAGEKLKELGYVDEDFIASMHEKEQIHPGSTYLGNGIAIPHGSKRAKASIKHTGIVVLHFRNGIEYCGEKVYLAFGIAAVKEDHICILSEIAELFEDESAVQKLRNAPDKKDFLNFFK